MNDNGSQSRGRCSVDALTSILLEGPRDVNVKFSSVVSGLLIELSRRAVRLCKRDTLRHQMYLLPSGISKRICLVVYYGKADVA